MSESTDSPRPMQFSLKETCITITVISVILAVSKLVGGLSFADAGLFLIGSASALLALSRLFTWLGAGLLFSLAVAILTVIAARDAESGMIAGVGVWVLYAFAGAPLAIAKARGLHMRRWLVSEIGILLVASAITPADPISTLLVYVPLQIAMLGYVFFAKDGAPQQA